jgi:uncharacterized protein
MAGDTIRVEVIHVEIIRAWPRRHESRALTLPVGATVAQALAAAAFEGDAPAGLAVFGEAVAPERVLVDGDRVEVLRPLRIDPKEARRRRAVAGK